MIEIASENRFEKAIVPPSDTSSLSSSFFTPDTPFLSVPRRTAPTVVRGLRSVLTAFIALSVGVALVWWLKAGSEDPRPALEKGAATATPVSGRASWAHRNELAPPTPAGSHH